MAGANVKNRLNPAVHRRALVVVAHPDDETLWAGGTILARPDWSWRVLSLCRASDADRAPKFADVLTQLNATGAMADLDDGPEQTPLADNDVDHAITAMLPEASFDLAFTHGPRGEYTRHRRHEESCRAVARLWSRGVIQCDALLCFAFEDGGRAHLPRPVAAAPVHEDLTDAIWRRKYDLVTQCYGFSAESWEARATPRAEAFWFFDRPEDAVRWIDDHGVQP